MNIVQTVGLGFVMVLALTFGQTMAYGQMESHHKIFVLVDYSGTNWSLEEFEVLKEQFMVQLSKLQGNYFYQFASVDVIETSSGRLVWSGSISEIQSDRGKVLKEAISSAATNCNSLASAFGTLDHNLKFHDGRKYTDIKIFVLSNLYNTPVPCDRNTRIVYPSLPPQEVNIPEILMQRPETSVIVFYGLHEAQMKVWGDALVELTTWELAEDGRVFHLYQESQTIAELNKGLEGVMP